VKSLSLFLAGLLGGLVNVSIAASEPGSSRAANTSLTLPLEPPVFGFTTTNAFPGLVFSDPVALAVPPGETRRLFVVEQAGRIVVITNLAQPTRTIFLDLRAQVVSGGERGLLGLAFHPQYSSNGYFYVFYTLNATTSAGGGLHDRLARFSVSSTNANAAAPDSELPLFTQRDEAANHNGGDLHFGPDGYLYVALGDEGGANDQYRNSQRIDRDFFAGILRIDVDRRPGSLAPNPHPAATLNYAVPADNPFVGATAFNGLAVDPDRVRTEFWATGLRNPWRMAFDRLTGLLYCGDVGQGAREEINIIERGGNYGWLYQEGTLPGPVRPPSGFTSIPPIVEYSHGNATNQGFSVTGGLVYRGERLAQLYGAYLFADYVSGNIWATRYDGQRASGLQWLARDPGISAFGSDPRNGDILLCDLAEDMIKRLTYSTNVAGSPLPATLEDTGAFSDLATLTPQPGILPYEINVPFWSDGADKQRWFSLPDPGSVIGFHREANWTFPPGAIWIKHFEIELTNGVPSSTRRLETRFLVRNPGGVYGITYRWNIEQTNASLVPEDGQDEELAITHADGVRRQLWRYPSRAECLACHTASGGYALGFNTGQLNRAVSLGEARGNQIALLEAMGYFQPEVTGLSTLPALAPATDNTSSLEYRVRSYLAVNCAHCHQPGSLGVGLFDARLSTPTAEAGLVNGPLNDPEGNPDNRVLAPSAPERSALLQRIARLGPGRMPPLASSVIDRSATNLLHEWITTSLPGYRTFAQWQQEQFGDDRSPAAGETGDWDGDGTPNQIEYLTGTDPRNPDDSWRLQAELWTDVVRLRFPRVANRGFQVQTTTNLPPAARWESLDVPGNRPVFGATDAEALIEDPITDAPSKFYRILITTP
jgi:uncharacterized repeat protein (TIGR03806 family)